MTRYEVGFMNKCAEYGVDAETALQLMQKKAGGKLEVVKNAPALALAWMLDKGLKASTARSLGKPMLSSLRPKAKAKWLTRLLSNNAGYLDDSALNFITAKTGVPQKRLMELAPTLKAIQGFDNHAITPSHLFMGNDIREALRYRTPYWFRR